MKKKIIFTLLAVLGFAVCYPALFILIGSLMSEGELQNNLSAIINDRAGIYARWALLPEDMTLEGYKDLFLYFHQDMHRSPCRTCNIRSTLCLRLCHVRIQIQKNIIYNIHHSHGDAVSGADAARIYGSKKPRSHKHAVGYHIAGSIFDLSGVHNV
mgnify:CR=1 FL=1